MAEAVIDMGDTMRQITMRVRVVGATKARIRLAITLWLLKLAGWVSPTEVEISTG